MGCGSSNEAASPSKISSVKEVSDHALDESKTKSRQVIPPLLSCRMLKDLLQSSPRRLSILETDFGKETEQEFQKGHIPKAQYFDQLECTTPTNFIPRGLPDVKCFEGYLKRLGVSNSDHIVLYDRSQTGFFAAARGWLLLKAYGVDNLSILNGGFHRWVKEINEIESTTSDNLNNETANFTVKLNEAMIRNFDQMMANLSLEANSTEQVQVVDARPPHLFNGADAGHMPHALNLPYATVLDQENQCLKSNDQLLEIFNQTGVDLSKPAIYTCHTGTTASTLAFIAHLLGQKQSSVYIGAFTEWQQRAPANMIIKNDDEKVPND